LIDLIAAACKGSHLKFSGRETSGQVWSAYLLALADTMIVLAGGWQDASCHKGRFQATGVCDAFAMVISWLEMQ
jgi:hypothetical protein